MTRRAQDRKSRHVRSEERKEKNERAQRATGKKIVLRLFTSPGATKGKDADVEHCCEVDENNYCWNHRAASSSGLRCSISRSRWTGQANFTSSHINSAAATEKQP